MENRKPLAAEQDALAADSIDLVALSLKLLENLKYMILAMVICGVAAGLFTHYALVPQYQSTAKLYLVSASNAMLNLNDLNLGRSVASDYSEIFKTWEVQEQVLQNLQLPYSYGTLSRGLSITNPKDTHILNVTYTCADPKEAADIANEFALVGRDYIANVMAVDKPSLLSTAVPNYDKVSPNLMKNVLAGAVGGLLLVAAIVTLLFLMDDKIKSPEDLEHYAGMAVLAAVPYEDGKKKRKSAYGKYGQY